MKFKDFLESSSFEESRGQGGGGARKPDYRRHLDDDETSLFGDKMRDLYQQKRNDPGFIKKANKSARDARLSGDAEFDPANPQSQYWTGGGKIGMPHAIHGILHSQQPVANAIRKIGVDASAEDILKTLKLTNQQILPDKRYIDYMSIRALEDIKTKVQKNIPLDANERRLYVFWNSKQKNVVGGTSDWKLLSPPEAYKEMKANNIQVISQVEAELQFIEKVRKDVASGKVYDEAPEDKTLKKARQTGEIWMGDPEKIQSKYDIAYPNGVKQAMANDSDIGNKSDFPPMYFANKYHNKKNPTEI